MVQKYVIFIRFTMKYLFLYVLFISTTVSAQVFLDFEDSNPNDFEMNSPERWGIVSSNPLSGNYSLKHFYDNASSGNDQVSIRFDRLQLGDDTTAWSFSILYEYNPSSSNNWSAFLLSDMNAAEMHPGGSACAYILGVNFNGSDDLVKVWKTTDHSVDEIYNTNYNWQDHVGTDSMVTFHVMRYPDATWEINLQKNASDIYLGTFTDTSIRSGNYFGFYYTYTSTQDQKLTVDDISITGTFIVDTLPPSIEEIKVKDTSSVRILFSEPVNEDSLLNTNRYLIEFMGNPDSVTIISADEIILKYNSAFTNENMFDIQMLNMVDLNGNEAPELLDSFFYYQPYQHDILVTEFLADPLPVVDMPEFEFIEIFNNSPYNIDLDGWTIKTSRAEKEISDYMLPSGQHLILCHEDAISYFTGYGECMDILTSLSTLRNTSDTIQIYDQYGIKIDSVFYTDARHDPSKNEGGWSLELTNYERNCKDEANWKSSLHQVGGTPGMLNSVHDPNPDLTAPVLEDVTLQLDSILHIKFSEPIDKTGCSVFLLQNEWISPSLVAINDTMMQANAPTPLDEGEYKVIVKNFSDQCFNVTQADSAIFFHHVPVIHDIVINELLIDPTPAVELPENEFIELLNVSNFDLNLQNWKISLDDKTYTLPSYVLKSNQSVILTHGNAISYYSSLGDAIPVIGTTYFLPNSEGNLKLISPKNVLIDSLIYKSKWYEENLDGTSLERMHNEFSCLHPCNLLPSLDPSGGTPGKTNSRLEPEPKIDVSIEKVVLRNDSTFLIQFSDYIDTTSSLLVSVSNPYELSAYSFPETNAMHVTLEYPVKSMDTVQILIKGLLDLCGNTLDELQTSTILFFPAKHDVLITEIMADPLPVVSLPEFEYVELYNNTLYDVDLTGWTLETSGGTKFFKAHLLPSKERLILCHEDAIAFFNQQGTCMDLFSSISTLLNTKDTLIIRDQQGNMIDSVFYSEDWHSDGKSDGGWSLELTHYERPCRPQANWKSSTHPWGGTPGQINSVHQSIPDNKPPSILKVQHMNDTSCILLFDQNVDFNKLSVDCYQSDSLNPTIEYLSDSCISIQLQPPLEEGSIHFRVNHIEDYCYNTSSDTFEIYYQIPQKHEVLITEFMVDPSPGKGLPEYEFIELYNTSEFEINLGGWQIKITAGIYEIPPFVLHPKNSVILTYKNAGNEFDNYGTALPVFQSKYFLPNGYSQIVLLSKRNGIIDSLYYNTDWYSANLDGTSLVRFREKNLCSHPQTIRPSANPFGGNPGLVSHWNDSVVTTQTVLERAELLADTCIKLTFSGILDTSELNQCNITSNYRVSMGDSDCLTSLNFYSQTPVPSGDTLTMKVDDLFDVCGNSIEPIHLSFTPFIPGEFDLLLTEIMADPEPVVALPNAEYIEIFNSSDYPVKTEALKLYINDEKISILPGTLEAGEYHLFIDDDDDESAFKGIENVHMVSSLNLLNTKNELVLFNSKDEIIHFASYDRDLFTSEMKKEGGWSLELGNLKNPCNLYKVWMESESYLGGTPGKINSFSEVEITNVPELIRNIGVPADNCIRIYLNEYIPMNDMKQMQVAISPALEIDTMVFDLKSVSLDIHIEQSLSKSKTYQLQLKNVTDCNQHVFNSKIHLIGLPEIPEPGDILFSEVMFEPADGYSEFIEIYNASDKIVDAGYLFLQYASSDPEKLTLQSLLLFPGDYLLLCENKTTCSASYLIPSDNLIEMKPFPALNNSDGTIALSFNQEVELDKFYYSADLHHQSLVDVCGVSLERVSFETPTDQSGNWQSAASVVGYCTPGAINSKRLSEFQSSNQQLSVKPEVFTPNNDGEKDLLEIHYHLPDGEYTLNLSVFDPSGRLVQHLSRNDLIPSSGVLFWDGMDAEHKPVGTGIYVLLFEAIGTNGKIIRKKETCVLAN